MSKTMLLSLLVLVFSTTFAQEPAYQPTAENLEAREWFQDAKFGLFVHWGVYSVLGDGEWVMQVQSIPKTPYEKLASFFNPIDFDPAEWVAMVKDAGMKYITITSKHHDGFGMFDSELTDWDIVDRTPYQKDVLKALADECHKQGIRLFFYYSQLDWHHNDYYPRGNTGKSAGRPDTGNWDAYIDYMNAQLTELLTGYGDIAGIWFDGMWDKREADWRLQETYSLIHDLQPGCLIGSNHHRAPKPGEDIQMFEKDLPGQNKSGFSKGSEVGNLPLETCETMNHSWGFNLQDRDFKTSRDLIHYLVKAACHNANFLLNVGPMPNGNIQQECVDTLKIVGDWMDTYGETLYGTRGGPIPPADWGGSTRKDDVVYVHILNWQDDAFLITGLDTIQSIHLYSTGEALDYTQTEFGTVVDLSYTEPLIDRVLTIKTENK
ncbi:MAG: alpha-L-fucosidase [candidate division KSB1 bacterium]|nr:alpha-L-fucosidase [candidate division KSB1 bacterium]